jgi:hypothetical protein
MLSKKRLTATIITINLYKKAGKQCSVFRPGLTIDTVTHTGAFYFSFDDPDIFKLPQMLGNGRLSKAEQIDQISFLYIHWL